MITERKKITMKITVKNVAPNPFVKRHTPESPFSHSSLPLDLVANLLKNPDVQISEGYRPASYSEGGRVIIARLPENLSENFFSAIALIREGEEVLEGFRARQEGEEERPYREVIRDEKPVAKVVDLVFYNTVALAQDDDNSLPIDPENWELISINASEDNNMERPPMTPNALKANYYGLSGGTKTEMSEEEYKMKMEISKAYWDRRANIRLRSTL